MFKDWTYKRKNIAFLVGLVLILILGYQLSISKTLDLRNSNLRLEQSAVNSDQLHRKAAVLKRDRQRIDSLRQALDVQTGDQLLLRQLTGVSKPSLTPLVEYSEVRKRETREKFNLFRFSGSYHDLLELLHNIELRRLGGGLVSARFVSETNKRTRETKLYMTIYFSME